MLVTRAGLFLDVTMNFMLCMIRCVLFVFAYLSKYFRLLEITHAINLGMYLTSNTYLVSIDTIFVLTFIVVEETLS